MLVTFKSKSYPNITMFGDVARRMLELMDFGSRVPGAIVASDVPVALVNLQTGLQAIPREMNDSPRTEDDEPTVEIHTRALPLIELLQAAVAGDNAVRWE
ncbi:MAG: DUF1840 domain-containing protein [Gammaproteobacteria bacterium]|nr:DUF1840 domain-containing protein [Gammaproteobacteria bacterium]